MIKTFRFREFNGKKREPALVAIRTEKGKPFRQFPRNLRLFFSLHRSKVCTQTNIWEREREESLLRAMDVSIPIDNWISFQSLHSTHGREKKENRSQLWFHFPPSVFEKKKEIENILKPVLTGTHWPFLPCVIIPDGSLFFFIAVSHRSEGLH
jgi:hypothetical protein